MPEQLKPIIGPESFLTFTFDHLIRTSTGTTYEDLNAKQQESADKTQSKLDDFREALKQIDRSESHTEVGKGQLRIAAAQKAYQDTRRRRHLDEADQDGDQGGREKLPPCSSVTAADRDQRRGRTRS
jgi:Skp family chaperone for outer membrane proteins